VIRGTFKPGDKAEIRPGINVAKDKKGNANYKPLIVTIESISTGEEKLDKAIAGGLIAIGTDMDPAMTKADGLVGQIIGHVGKLPESKTRYR
jgi:Translation initiation factor 2, gamma subunit (eIF-2gamma; GTPase)